MRSLFGHGTLTGIALTSCLAGIACSDPGMTSPLGGTRADAGALQPDIPGAAGNATVDAGAGGAAGNATVDAGVGGAAGSATIDAGVGGAAGSGGSGQGVCVPGTKQCNNTTPQTCDATGNWVNGTACASVCSDGTCTGSCVPNSTQCSGAIPQTCNSAGEWLSGPVTTGACGAVCVPGSTQCSGATPQICGSSGQWNDAATPCPYLCRGGTCTGICVPGTKQCSGATPQTCDATGAWVNGPACPNVCSQGTCTGSCVPNSTQCNGATPQTCNNAGQWVSGSVTLGACGAVCTPGATQCSGATPQTCSGTGQWVPGSVKAGSCGAVCAPGSAQSCAAGSCSGGTQVCSASGQWGSCSLPSDCQCVPGQTQACSGSTPCGTATCRSNKWDYSGCTATTIWYKDLDGNGLGAGTGTAACAKPSGSWATNNRDCESCDCRIHVYQKSLAPSGVNDVMLTTLASEGGGVVLFDFFTYKSAIPGKTTTWQFARCYSRSLGHFVSTSEKGCGSATVEGYFGYPLLTPSTGGHYNALCQASCAGLVWGGEQCLTPWECQNGSSSAMVNIAGTFSLPSGHAGDGDFITCP